MYGVTAFVKVLITQQLNAFEILFSARKQSIGAQRKRLNTSPFHSLLNNETSARVLTHYIHTIFFNMKEERRGKKREREHKKERMSKPTTNDARRPEAVKPLSRKWKSFTGFSVFDRPFVYHSLNGSSDLEGSITPRSYTWVYVNCHLCRSAIIHEAVNFYFFRSPKRIDREDSFRSFEWRVSAIQSAVRLVGAVHAKVVTVGTARWWFICRVNRKTKPLDGFIAERTRTRERSMQCFWGGCIWNSNGLAISRRKITYVDY